MKTSKLICAAMAAVMTASTAASVVSSADFSAEDTDSAIAVTESADVADQKKNYDEADWEYYKREYWETIYWEDDLPYDPDAVPISITNEGLIYHEYSDHVEVTDYVGKGDTLVIPKKINGKKVTGFENLGWDGIIYGFKRVRYVKTLVIEAKLDCIGTVFTDCPDLEKVVLPEGLERFDDIMEVTCCAFRDCPKLKDVTIPSTLKVLTSDCFRNTPWLDAREEKEGLVIVGETVLSGRKAKGKVVIPNNVKWLSGNAFEGNTTMTELVIPASVECTGGAFWNTTGLKKITFKNGSPGIYEYFSRQALPNLKQVIIPPSVTLECAACALGFDEYDGDWKEHINKKCTYYYYKGSSADTVINNKKVKGYKLLKKSVLPGKTKSVKVTAKKKAVNVKWTAVSTATGYQIQISSDKKFKNYTRTVNVAGKTKTSRSIKRLTSGKKYYVRMRTYKTLSGQRYYGNYTKIRSVKVK